MFLELVLYVYQGLSPFFPVDVAPQVAQARNMNICMGKKPIVSVTYENERISIKNSLPHFKCVLPLSCVVHGPIKDRFMERKSITVFFLHTNPYISGEVTR